LRDHPHLRECVTHCVHCGIRFLTDPRNARRTNLRCPFGCREHHRRQASSHRATAYYRTEQGKRKKEVQNARRKKETARRQGQSCTPAANEPTESRPPDSCRPRQTPPATPAELPTDVQLVLDAVALTPRIIVASPVLPYLTIIIGVIERRSISRSDLVAHLLELLRQHSMAPCLRKDYVLGFQQRHPP